MKRMGIAVLVAALLGATGRAPAAHAADGTSALCHYVFAVHFSPGLSADNGSGTYGTGDETGSVNCVGSINGHRVSGVGTFGFEGTFSGNCMSGSGSGTYTKTIPTDQGILRLTGTFKERRLGLSSTVDSAGQAGGQGQYVALPTKGDCISAPVTHVLVTMVDRLGG